MSARLRVPRKSLKNVVASEPSQTGDAILPSFISSPTPGTSAQGDESGLSTPESSDNEDVQPEGRVACRNFSFVNNMFPSQGSGHDMNVKNGDSESVHDDVDVELCAVWKGRTRSLGRIAQRALLHQKILAPLPTLPMYPSAGSGVAQHFKGTCWRVLYKVWSRMVARPSSQRRLMWDFMGMALIGYDVIVIPLSSFDPPPNLFTHTMGWVCTIYWTIDIPCTLLVGYHTKGVLEMRPLQIASHYLRTWLAFDASVVSVDWMCAVAENWSGSDDLGNNRVGYLRFGRFGRFLRMLRLLRLLKVHGMITDIFERIHSEFVRIIFGIANILIFIILINHVLACGWYMVGTRSFEAGYPSWVVTADLADRTTAYNYTTSVHWSLTQFTPASMEVVPKNTFERTYTVCTLLFAMVTFSSFVSSITNAMTRLRNLNSDSVEKATVLRQYLKENRIPGEVCNRIWAWLQYTEDTSKSRTHEKQVAILPILPAVLQTELHRVIYKPLLDKHPWFARFARSNMDAMRGLYRCLVEVGLTFGKELFHTGQHADRMWFVFSGNLRYLRDGEVVAQSWEVEQCAELVKRSSSYFDHSDSQTPVTVGPGQWASEHPLWIQWNHVGQLVGMSHCELFAVEAQKFQDLMQYELHGIWQAAKYARAFYSFLNWSRVALSDVWADLVVLDDMADRAFCEIEDDLSSSDMDSPRSSPFASIAPSARNSDSERKMSKLSSDLPGRGSRRSLPTSNSKASVDLPGPQSPASARRGRRRSF